MKPVSFTSVEDASLFLSSFQTSEEGRLSLRSLASRHCSDLEPLAQRRDPEIVSALARHLVSGSLKVGYREERISGGPAEEASSAPPAKKVDRPAPRRRPPPSAPATTPAAVPSQPALDRGYKHRSPAEKKDVFHPEVRTLPPDAQMNSLARKAAAEKDPHKKRQLSYELGTRGGENMTRDMAASRGGLKPPKPPLTENPKTFHGPRTTDTVAFCEDGVVVTENKGGKSSRGTARVGSRRISEGHPAYLKDVALKMSKSPNPERSAAGLELVKQINKDPQKVSYCEARTKYSEKGASNTEAREYDP